MKMKSMIALSAMLTVLVSSVFAIPASAAPEQDSIVDKPVTPRFSHASYVTSSLNIYGGTAVCISEGEGKAHVASMNCMQYLEKKNLFGNYTIIVNNWFQSSGDNYLFMSNTQPDIGSGTYRLRSVFTFYAVGGYEEVTDYAYC